MLSSFQISIVYSGTQHEAFKQGCSIWNWNENHKLLEAANLQRATTDYKKQLKQQYAHEWNSPCRICRVYSGTLKSSSYMRRSNKDVVSKIEMKITNSLESASFQRTITNY